MQCRDATFNVAQSTEVGREGKTSHSLNSNTTFVATYINPIKQPFNPKPKNS